MEKYEIIQTQTPQEFIHIKHDISAVQYKYWFILIKVFQEYLSSGVEPDNKGFYSVSITELEKLIGYEIKTKDLKSDLFSLSGTAIAFNYIKKNGEKVFYGASFLPEFEVYSKTVKFILPSFIKSILLGESEYKKMFLIMDWSIFNSFNGKYEAIIYKLCKDYLGFGKTKYFTIKEYRDYIGLKDNEYKEFKALNRRAISEPIENINKNELSDIFIKVEFKKQGRKVLGFHFEIKPKNKTPILDIVPLEPNPVFEKSLIPINPQKQVEYLQKYSDEQIKFIIEYVNAQNEQGKIKNLGAYYHQAFANGYGLENFEAEQKKKAEADEKKRKAEAIKEAELKAEKERQELIKKEKEKAIETLKLFESFTIDEQEKILDKLQEAINPIMRKYFIDGRKNGENPHKTPPYSYMLSEVIKQHKEKQGES